MCGAGETSQAEQLAALLPPSLHLVKALNTLSAHQLGDQNSPGGAVPLAGDSAPAKAAVAELVAGLGYRAQDWGGLDQASRVENLPLRLFPAWRAPLGVSAVLWLLLFTLQFGRWGVLVWPVCTVRPRTHLCGEEGLGWHGAGLTTMLFTKHINKTSDGHALVLLAACYLPGVLAGTLH